MLGRLFQSLQKRIGSLFIRPIDHTVDQKDPARTLAAASSSRAPSTGASAESSICRSGPSGAKVESRDATRKTEDLRCASPPVHFSRSAMIEIFASRLRSSCSILCPSPKRRSKRRARVALPTPSGPDSSRVWAISGSASCREILGDRPIRRNFLNEGISKNPRYHARCQDRLSSIVKVGARSERKECRSILQQRRFGAPLDSSWPARRSRPRRRVRWPCDPSSCSPPKDVPIARPLTNF